MIARGSTLAGWLWIGRDPVFATPANTILDTGAMDHEKTYVFAVFRGIGAVRGWL